MVYNYFMIWDYGEIIMNTMFTQREITILNELITGKSYPQISECLFISIPTVKYYMGQISEKLGIKGKINIVLYILTHKHLIQDNIQE